MRELVIIVIALALSATSAGAAIRPAALFSDNAVLQRGIAVPVWGFADNGEKVTVKFQNQELSTVAKDGKWMVKLAPLNVGGPYTMTITGSNTIELKNILVGEVWICGGQSNMQWPVQNAANGAEAVAAATDSKIRLFSVPRKASYTPVDDVEASWAICTPKTVADFTAVGYFFGRDLRKTLDVPIGLIDSSWGGTIAKTWTSPEGFKTLPDYAPWTPDEKANEETRKNQPSVQFNTMIKPLMPYAIKGAIWYQGESDAQAAYQYRIVFPTLIKSWRKAWGEGDFPFLFVQLAPFTAIQCEPQESEWAELMEAQLLTFKTCPKTGMVVTTDYGDPNDVHSRRKEPVGVRLALAARKIAYGEDIVYSGPIYKAMKVKGDSITLYFDHVGGGLVAKDIQSLSKDGALIGFSIAGADKKFVWATATIVGGNKVVVSASGVSNPVAVRYGWATYPVVNLYNKENLPASPFRTDDFPMLTNPRK